MEPIDTIQERYTVLVVDIRRSTEIVQRLQEDELTGWWAALLARIHEDISTLFPDDAKVYKFLGDGWLILFKTNNDGLISRIGTFLDVIFTTYDRLYNESLQSLYELEETLPHTNVSFAITTGTLTKFDFPNSEEYVGKAINEAFRLQSLAAGGDGYDEPYGYIDRPTYAAFREAIEGAVMLEKHALRGISESEKSYYRIYMTSITNLKI